MNDILLTQLKIIVERAVRPVRASTARKRKMREELLAHVSAVFEEELARLGDEKAALARTAERFGTTADVTGQLQESVPTRDAVDRFIERILYPAGESPLWRAVRQASLVGVFTFVILTAASAGEWSMDLLWFGQAMALSAFLIVFEYQFLAAWMRHAQCGPAGFSWLEVMRVALIASVMFPPSLFLPQAMLAPQVQQENTMLAAAFFGVVMVVVLTVMARSVDARERKEQDWANLDIGKGAPA